MENVFVGITNTKRYIVITRGIRWLPARKFSLARLLRRANCSLVPMEMERDLMDKVPSQRMIPLDSRITWSQAVNT